MLRGVNLQVKFLGGHREVRDLPKGLDSDMATLMDTKGQVDKNLEEAQKHFDEISGRNKEEVAAKAADTVRFSEVSWLRQPPLA